jgi:hypothetical protein
MRTSFFTLVATLFVLPCLGQEKALPPKSGLIFLAVMGSIKDPRVIVLDAASGKSSGWIPLGTRFGEYLVVSYDSSSESLTLKRDETKSKVHLIADAKITDAPSSGEVAVILPDGYEAADCKILKWNEEDDGNGGLYRGYRVLWEGQEVDAGSPVEKPEFKAGDMVRVLKMKLFFPGAPDKTGQVTFIVAPRIPHASELKN